MNDYESARPIYLQIMEKIKSKIILGELEPGGKLLSIRDMALKMGVNPNTMNRVYTELENEGIVETKRGLGTFIVEDTAIVERFKDEVVDERILNLVETLLESGFSKQQILSYIKTALERAKE